MAWKGVITNSGSELLAQWTAGKTLTITRAAAGTGRVSEAAMLAQTALVSEKQTVSILSNKTTAQGQKLQLQVTPLATGYPLNQLGIWAKLDSGGSSGRCTGSSCRGFSGCSSTVFSSEACGAAGAICSSAEAGTAAAKTSATATTVCARRRSGFFPQRRRRSPGPRRTA